MHTLPLKDTFHIILSLSIWPFIHQSLPHNISEPIKWILSDMWVSQDKGVKEFVKTGIWEKKPNLLLLHRRSNWTTLTVFSTWQSSTHHESRWDFSLPFTHLPTPAFFARESTLAQLFPVLWPMWSLQLCSTVPSSLPLPLKWPPKPIKIQAHFDHRGREIVH